MRSSLSVYCTLAQLVLLLQLHPLVVSEDVPFTWTQKMLVDRDDTVYIRQSFANSHPVPLHRLFNPSYCVEGDCTFSLYFDEADSGKMEAQLTVEFNRIRPEYADGTLQLCTGKETYLLGQGLFNERDTIQCPNILQGPSLTPSIPIAQGVYMFMSTHFLLERQILEMHKHGHTSVYFPFHTNQPGKHNYQYLIMADVQVPRLVAMSCIYDINGVKWNNPTKLSYKQSNHSVVVGVVTASRGRKDISCTCKVSYMYRPNQHSLSEEVTRSITIVHIDDPTILLGEELNATQLPSKESHLFFASEDQSADVRMEILSSTPVDRLEVTSETGGAVDNIFTLYLSTEQLMIKFLLVFSWLSEDTTGKYLITFTNTDGFSAKKLLKVTVTQMPNVDVSPLLIRASVSDSVAFDCVVTGGHIEEIWWVSQEETLGEFAHMTTFDAPVQGGVGKRLTFGQLQLNDSGPYTCWARTRLQRSYAQVDLNVFPGGDSISNPASSILEVEVPQESPVEEQQKEIWPTQEITLFAIIIACMFLLAIGLVLTLLVVWTLYRWRKSLNDETRSKGDTLLKKLDQRQRPRKDTMPLLRKCTSKIPEEWAKLLSDDKSSDTSISRQKLGGKKRHNSVWIYHTSSVAGHSRKTRSHTKDVSIYQKCKQQLQASSRRSSRPPGYEQAKQVTYDEVPTVSADRLSG